MGTHKVGADVVEVLAVLLERLLEQVRLRRRPLLHLVAAQHRPAHWHHARQRRRDVVAVPVQDVHRVELQQQQSTQIVGFQRQRL